MKETRNEVFNNVVWTLVGVVIGSIPWIVTMVTHPE